MPGTAPGPAAGLAGLTGPRGRRRRRRPAPNVGRTSSPGPRASALARRRLRHTVPARHRRIEESTRTPARRALRANAPFDAPRPSPGRGGPTAAARPVLGRRPLSCPRAPGMGSALPSLPFPARPKLPAAGSLTPRTPSHHIRARTRARGAGGPAAWRSMPTCTSTPSTRARRAGTATSSTSPSGAARKASPSSAPATSPTPRGGPRSGRSSSPRSRASTACGRTSNGPSRSGSPPPAGARGPPSGSSCRWRSPPSTRSSRRPGRSTTSSTPPTSRRWSG